MVSQAILRRGFRPHSRVGAAFWPGAPAALRLNRRVSTPAARWSATLPIRSSKGSTFRRRVFAIAILLVAVFGIIGMASTATAAATYSDPSPVTIQGYSGSAEVPFLTPDGQYLVFDNRRDPGTPDVRIYYAKKIDKTTFQFMGEVAGVNLPGSPNFEMTIDNDNNFYFTRLDPSNLAGGKSNIYRGIWNNGTVSNVAPVAGLVPALGTIDQDPTISPDGRQLIFDNWDLQNRCITYKIALKNVDGSFTVLTDADSRLAQYAAQLRNIYGDNYFNKCRNFPFPGSGDPVIGPFFLAHSGLEGVFTIINPAVPEQRYYLAARTSTAEAFGAPQVLVANGRIVEGGSFSPDDRDIYFHLSNGDGTFSPYVVSKTSGQ